MKPSGRVCALCGGPVRWGETYDDACWCHRCDYALFLHELRPSALRRWLKDQSVYPEERDGLLALLRTRSRLCLGERS